MAKNLVEKRLRERLRRKKSKNKIVVDIDKVLPDIKTIELEGEEKKEYIYKLFHDFYKQHIFVRNSPDAFFNLPVEFFTYKNAKRLREYVDIAFDKILEDLQTGKRENILDSEEYYISLRAKIKRRISNRRSEFLKLEKDNGLAK